MPVLMNMAWCVLPRAESSFTHLAPAVNLHATSSKLVAHVQPKVQMYSLVSQSYICHECGQAPGTP